jgi:hypothetical protein
MFLHRHHLIVPWPDRSRRPLLLLALVLMFGSAYSILKFFATAGAVSNWMGLPQYAAQISRLQAEGGWWEALAIVLPFLAALVLGFGRPPLRHPRRRAASASEVFYRVAVRKVDCACHPIHLPARCFDLGYLRFPSHSAFYRFRVL